MRNPGFARQVAQVIVNKNSKGRPMTITSLTLYHYPISRSARVKWLLHELELGGHIDGFETVTLDLMRGAGMAPEFMAKNPNHAVPVLDMEYADGRAQTLIESGAMLSFLTDHYQNAGLGPDDDPIARADYHQMLYFGASWFDMMLWQIRLHRDLLPKKIRSQAMVDMYMGKIENEVAPQLLARLSKHDYICGDRFTTADIMTGYNINWAGAYGLCRTPEFKAYMGRMKSRPAFQLAFADAQDFEK